MRLHILGLPHTITTEQFSHCAFTGKVKKFSPMMRNIGYEVWHYGVEGAESGADVQVDVMSRAEQIGLTGHDHSDPTKFHGDDANVGNALYRTYNTKLRPLLEQNVGSLDIVCHPFGHAHVGYAETHRGQNVETGIGYPTTAYDLRVYESRAWQAWHQGKYGRGGTGYEWVIPNYFVADDWPTQTSPEDYVLYFGRICDIKGLPTIVEMARAMPHQRFVICGQGNPTPYLKTPNIEYRKPVLGKERAPLLGNAKLVVMPTNYIEPFGGVAVEAMMTGTPVAAVPYGVFPETIWHGVTGWHCRTLHDWIQAVALASELERPTIAQVARAKYSLEAVAPEYDRVFQMVRGLRTGKDWYSFPASF